MLFVICTPSVLCKPRANLGKRAGRNGSFPRSDYAATPGARPDPVFGLHRRSRGYFPPGRIVIHFESVHKKLRHNLDQLPRTRRVLRE